MQESSSSKVSVPEITSPEALVRFVNSIVVMCPRCAQTGNLLYTESEVGLMKHEKVGVAIPCQCMFCGTGILLAIKSDRVTHTIPFEGSQQFMEAMRDLLDSGS